MGMIVVGVHSKFTTSPSVQSTDTTAGKGRLSWRRVKFGRLSWRRCGVWLGSLAGALKKET